MFSSTISFKLIAGAFVFIVGMGVGILAASGKMKTK